MSTIRQRILAYMKTHRGRRNHFLMWKDMMDGIDEMSDPRFINPNSFRRTLNQLASDPKTHVKSDGAGYYWFVLEDTTSSKLTDFFGGKPT